MNRMIGMAFDTTTQPRETAPAARTAPPTDRSINPDPTFNDSKEPLTMTTTTTYMILTHSLARTGLRLCLSAAGNEVSVIGDSPDAATGWSEVCRLNPDVLLLDPPSLAALQNAGALPVTSGAGPTSRLVLLVAPSDMDQLDLALRLGVRGFIDSSSTPEALVPALTRVARGERFVSTSLLQGRDTASEPAQPHAGVNPEERLSAREMEVFTLTAEGLEAKEIGDRLGISPRTVDVHRASMRQKLGLVGVHELIRFAVTWTRDRMRSSREDRFCHQTQPLLLVEDDAVDVLSVERALAKLRVSFPVQNRTNGEDALAYLRNPSSPRPFLILLDVNMPRMNGHEFLTELRKDPELRSIPVIVFTTSALDSDRARMYDTGIAGFMVKPTRTEEFVQMFRALAEYWGLNAPPPPPSRGTTPAVAVDPRDASAGFTAAGLAPGRQASLVA